MYLILFFPTGTPENTLVEFRCLAPLIDTIRNPPDRIVDLLTTKTQKKISSVSSAMLHLKTPQISVTFFTTDLGSDPNYIRSVHMISSGISANIMMGCERLAIPDDTVSRELRFIS